MTWPSTRRSRRSYSFYGTAAFPISYPNEWDRRQGRNGFGIWLHGTPSDTYSRPPRASDGCVVLTNQDIQTMNSALKIAIDQRNIVPIHFALGRAWHDRKKYERAFGHFETGNRMRGDTINYRPEDLSSEVDEIIRLFDRNFFGRRERAAGRRRRR